MTLRLQKAAAQIIELYANEVSSSPALRELNEALIATGWVNPLARIPWQSGPNAGKLAIELTKRAIEGLYGPPKQLKPGEPGFEWPECEQCGSRSLRCGCD